jgi:hypothetical protein
MLGIALTGLRLHRHGRMADRSRRRSSFINVTACTGLAGLLADNGGIKSERVQGARTCFTLETEQYDVASREVRQAAIIIWSLMTFPTNIQVNLG